MRVIVIGSGIAGITFAEALRVLSVDTKITLLTKENKGYYSRPQLSIGFSQDNIEQSIIIKPFNELLNDNICVISGVEVTRIDRSNQRIDIRGVDEIESLEYDILILAMGSASFIPPPFVPFQDCFYLLNSLVDLIKLRQFRDSMLLKNRPPHWAIIGGGLIGCEVASDLTLAKDQVTIFHAMNRLMERQLLEDDSEKLLNSLQASGINVLLNQVIKGFKRTANLRQVITDSQQNHYDGIIVSCGFKPRIDLAVQAELNTGRGIKTNQFLQTNDKNIYALGDIAELPNGKLYAFIRPIRHQALWLANYLSNQQNLPWEAPSFSPSAKVNNFEAAHPYLF